MLWDILARFLPSQTQLTCNRSINTPADKMPLSNGEIKPITDTVFGVPSHCLQSKFVADPRKQYCANIPLKVNVKLGGSNHTTLNNGEIPSVSDPPTIVFGINISHPFPGSNASRARPHLSAGDWTDSAMTGDTGDMQAQMAAYATVNPNLQDVMYFM